MESHWGNKILLSGCPMCGQPTKTNTVTSLKVPCLRMLLRQILFICLFIFKFLLFIYLLFYRSFPYILCMALVVYALVEFLSMGTDGCLPLCLFLGLFSVYLFCSSQVSFSLSYYVLLLSLVF